MHQADHDNVFQYDAAHDWLGHALAEIEAAVRDARTSVAKGNVAERTLGGTTYRYRQVSDHYHEARAAIRLALLIEAGHPGLLRDPPIRGYDSTQRTSKGGHTTHVITARPLREGEAVDDSFWDDAGFVLAHMIVDETWLDTWRDKDAIVLALRAELYRVDSVQAQKLLARREYEAATGRERAARGSAYCFICGSTSVTKTVHTRAVGVSTSGRPKRWRLCERHEKDAAERAEEHARLAAGARKRKAAAEKRKKGARR